MARYGGYQWGTNGLKRSLFGMTTGYRYLVQSSNLDHEAPWINFNNPWSYLMKLPKLKFHAATLRSQAEPFSNTPDVHPRWHLGRAHGVIIWIQEETADDLSGRSVKPVPGQGCVTNPAPTWEVLTYSNHGKNPGFVENHVLCDVFTKKTCFCSTYNRMVLCPSDRVSGRISVHISGARRIYKWRVV